MAASAKGEFAKGGGDMLPPVGHGSAASTASPNPPEVLGSAALAASPTDPIFLQALRQLIDNPDLSEGVYNPRVWQHQASTPVRLGKYLSMALRHRARRLGMVLDQEGFCGHARSLECTASS